MAILARPFARRRFNTSRPAFDATRARNPWVLARWRVCGWYVRFGISTVDYTLYHLFYQYLLEILSRLYPHYMFYPQNVIIYPHIYKIRERNVEKSHPYVG